MKFVALNFLEFFFSLLNCLYSTCIVAACRWCKICIKYMYNKKRTKDFGAVHKYNILKI